MPYSVNEPTIPSYDAVYEVSGDSIDWNIGTINQDNSSGSFEFEAQADSDSAFFPLTVRFLKTKPFVDVDVSSWLSTSAHPIIDSLLFQVTSVTLANMNQDLPFSKDVKSVADKYLVA